MTALQAHLALNPLLPKLVLDGQSHHAVRVCVRATGGPRRHLQGGPGTPPGHMWPREPIREREVKRPTLIRAGWAYV